MLVPPPVRCAYCDISYDFLGKMETFQEDLEYLSRVARLPSWSTSVDHVRLNPSRPGATSSQERTLKYFSTLTERQKERLAQFYALDFEAFDYDPEPYLRT